MMEELVNARELVRQVLATDEKSRNNDVWLIMKVWQEKQHIKIFIPYDKIKEMIPAETITRVRREIQNVEKLYLPTDEAVINKRRQRETDFANYFSSSKKYFRKGYWSDGTWVVK